MCKRLGRLQGMDDKLTPGRSLLKSRGVCFVHP